MSNTSITGEMVARTWERLIGKGLAEDNIFKSPVLIPNGLILEPVSQGCHHEWEQSPINRIWTCRRCARSISELEICRNASSLASQLESYVQV